MAAGTLLAVTGLNFVGVEPTVRVLIDLTAIKVALLLTFVAFAVPSAAPVVHYALRSTSSSRSRRSGSASRSIPTTLPPLIAKVHTARGLPPGVHTAPGAPFMSARFALRMRPEKVSATACAPRRSSGAPNRTASPSAWSATSGSSRVSSASKSPAREAARNASTTSRWRLRLASGAARARLASFLAATGVRSTMGAQHPVSHCPQAAPVALELVRQPLVFVHQSHSFVAIRHYL